MKKNKLFLFAPAAAVIGAVIGYARSEVFYKYYDSYYGVLLSESLAAVTAVNCAIIIFALLAVFITRKSLSGSVMSHKITGVHRITVLLGSAIILMSAYVALTAVAGGLFAKCFAALAVISCIFFVMGLGKNVPMRELMSCSAVLPAALALINIYKDNIKYPNISLFAFEILSALFIMLGFYFISASYFKRVKPFMPVSCAVIALAFSSGAIVTDLAVRYTYIFEPVLPFFTTVYFIGANLVLIGFSLSVEAEKAEKLTYTGGDGFVLSNGEHSIAIDCTYPADGVFLSGKSGDMPENAVVTEEDSRYVIYDFAVCGFMYDGEGEPLYGQAVTTPNGKIIINLARCATDRLSEKTLKKLLEEYEKPDIIIMKYGEGSPGLPQRLFDELPKAKLILLNPSHEDLSDYLTTTDHDNAVLIPNGEYVL